jgi:UDP-GlcNAc:undecaprenyl-phosphate GlcNAc-1-phosphate transferase
LATAGVATGLSIAATACFRKLAWKIEFLDRPLGEMHKKHEHAIPLMGGMAILTAWALTLAAGVIGATQLPHLMPTSITVYADGVREILPVFLVIAGGGAALAVMGLIDDKRPLGPFVKLGLQILICGVVACYPKLRITLFWSQPIVTWCLTLFWFLFIINAFNFFDNMDGLSSGIAVIAALLFAVVAGLREQYFVATLAAVTAGSALGFYFYNRSPASIFMGDSGSHFLGYLLAVLGSLTVFYDPKADQTVAAVLIPLFVLALPVFDTFAVIVIRTRAGKPIYHGDHNHISHRFVKMGYDRKTAVRLVHLLALAIGLGALPLLWLSTTGALLVLAQAGAMLTLVSILHMNNSVGPEQNSEGQPEEPQSKSEDDDPAKVKV